MAIAVVDRCIEEVDAWCLKPTYHANHFGTAKRITAVYRTGRCECCGATAVSIIYLGQSFDVIRALAVPASLPFAPLQHPHDRVNPTRRRIADVHAGRMLCRFRRRRACASSTDLSRGRTRPNETNAHHTSKSQR